MRREDFLEKAKSIVSGERIDRYGEPEDSFETIAKYWSVWLGFELCSEDVAAMMILLKIARMHHTGSEDTLLDIAGYAACWGEMHHD